MKGGPQTRTHDSQGTLSAGGLSLGLQDILQVRQVPLYLPLKRPDRYGPSQLDEAAQLPFVGTGDSSTAVKGFQTANDGRLA